MLVRTYLQVGYSVRMRPAAAPLREAARTNDCGRTVPPRPPPRPPLRRVRMARRVVVVAAAAAAAASRELNTTSDWQPSDEDGTLVRSCAPVTAMGGHIGPARHRTGAMAGGVARRPTVAREAPFISITYANGRVLACARSALLRFIFGNWHTHSSGNSPTLLGRESFDVEFAWMAHTCCLYWESLEESSLAKEILVVASEL